MDRFSIREERSLHYGVVYTYYPSSSAFDRRRRHHLGLAHDFELCHRDLADSDRYSELSQFYVKSSLFLSFR
jgi:hypothetical protein